MKNESFIKGMVAVGAGTLINLIIGFFTTPIITRLVEPTDYGKFSIFTMYTNLVLMVLCLGMDQSLVRYYYKIEDAIYKKRLIFECAVPSILATLVFLIIALPLIYLNIIPFEFGWGITLLLAINIIGNVIFRFSSLIVRLNHNNKLYAQLQVLHKVFYIIFAMLFLIVIGMDGIYSLAIATIVSLFVCIVFSVVSQKAVLPCNRKEFSPDKMEISSLFKYGFPFIFSMGITSMFQSLDKLSLNHYRTYEEVGVYASAMTFVTLFSIVQSSFNTVWAPKSVEHYEKNPEDKEFYNTAFSIISVVMFSIGIGLILFKDLFVLLLGEKYREASYIMPFLIFQPIMYTISETTVVGIAFAKKSSLHVIIAVGACLTNFIGNTLLVPLLGCRGAAISTGISYILFLVLRTIFSEKNYHIGFNIVRFIVVTLLAIGYAAYNTFFKFNIFSVIMAILCYSILFFLYKDSVIWIIKKCKPMILQYISKFKKRIN